MLKADGICQKELKAGSQTDICMPMFTEALFTKTKRWKQPKCPSTDEWINKKQCTPAKVFYSIIKGNEDMIHATTWMNLENIMLNEISEIQKDKYCMNPLT